MATPSRPLVLPEVFTGGDKWEEWICHFENVADVNGWDDAEQLRWLKLRLTERAQTAFLRLPEAVRNDYKEAKKALQERFLPPSRQPRYQAEFQSRRKKAAEAWADYADDLKSLADKAYPELPEAAREVLAVNHYLQQLDQPQVAFAVKQRRPNKLDDAVAATLEMESYAAVKSTAAAISGVEEDETQVEIASVPVTSQNQKLTELVERLLERVEKLESSKETPPHEPAPPEERSGAGSMTGRRPPPGNFSFSSRAESFQGVCWTCGKRGHLARNCRKGQKQQGN